MKSNLKKVAVIAFVTLLPILALAQAPAGPITTVTSLNDILRIIETVIGWIFAFLMLLATVFVLYAAFLYLTAAGSEENLKRAKNIIIYAVVAIAVALLSRAVVFIVASIVR